MNKPTALQPKDYRQLMAFLEKSYRLPKNFFQTVYPHRWPEDIIQFENTYIIKKDNRIASHVRVFPLPLVIADGTVIESGGIGGVGTLQKYRGQGLMSRLLKHVTQEMTSQGLCMSVLWGARHRYDHFGWEEGGQETIFALTRNTLKKINVLPKIKMRPYKGDKKDLAKIIRIHNREPLYVKRTTEEYHRIFKKTNLKVWLGEKGSKQAYVIISNGADLSECGGDPQVILSLTKSLVKKNLSNVALPYYPTPFFKTCSQIADTCKTVSVAQIKILDLKKMMGFFLPQIETKWKKLGSTREYNLTLAIKKTQQKVTLHLGKKVSLTGQRRNGQVIRLSDNEMVRKLFSPAVQPNSILDLIFPLDFYIWHLDYI